MWYTYKMEYYSAIEWNEFLIYATWMKKYAKLSKPDIKGQIVHDSTYMKYLEQANS